MQPRLYLPIHETYQLPGPIYRLGESQAGRLRIETDQQHSEYIEKKKAAVGLWDSSDSRTLLEDQLSEWLAAVIRDDQPGLKNAGATSLDTMILNLQEDVVVMHRPTEQSPASHARAVYVNVCFPSSWCPQCALAKSFLSFHAGVPAADKFDPLERKHAAEHLFGKEDLVRFVWGLSPDDALDHRICRRNPKIGPPHTSVAFDWRTTTVAWLRVERQVVSPIDERTACFLIRTYLYKVSELESSVRERIRLSLKNMSVDVQKYKGYDSHVDRILSLI